MEVALEGDEDDTAVHTTGISSSLNDALPQVGPSEIITQMETSDEHSVRRPRHRSVIWKHFDHLDNLNAVRCRICMKQLVESGGVSNLWRHLSSKHPKVYSELVSTQQHPPTSLNSSQDSNTNPETDEAFWGTEKSDAPGKLLDRHIKVSHLHKQEITPCLSSSSVSVEEAKVSSVFCNQDKNRGMKTLYQGLVLQCDIDRRSPACQKFLFFHCLL